MATNNTEIGVPNLSTPFLTSIKPRSIKLNSTQIDAIRLNRVSHASNQNYIQPTRYANSLSDIVLGHPISGTRELQNTLAKYDAEALTYIPIINRIMGAAYMFHDQYIEPLQQGNVLEAGVNALESFGEDMDIIANPIKSLLPWAGGGTAEDFLKSMGWLEGEYREIYQWDVDTGNGVADFLINLAGEIVSDPVNWLSYGAKQGIKLGIDEFTPIIKQGLVKELGEEIVEVLPEEVIQQYAKAIAKDMVEGKRFIIEDLQNRLTLNASVVSLAKDKAIKGSKEYELLRNLNNNYRKALTKKDYDEIAQMITDVSLSDGYRKFKAATIWKERADLIDKTIFKASLAATPVGLPAFATYKYGKNFIKSLNNHTLTKLKNVPKEEIYNNPIKVYKEVSDDILRRTQTFYKDVYNKFAKILKPGTSLFDLQYLVVKAVNEVQEELWNMETLTKVIKEKLLMSPYLLEVDNIKEILDTMRFEELIDASIDVIKLNKNLKDTIFQEYSDYLVKSLNDYFESTYNSLGDFGTKQILNYFESTMQINGRQYKLEELQEFLNTLRDTNSEEFTKVDSLLSFLGLRNDNYLEVTKLYRKGDLESLNKLEQILKETGNKGGFLKHIDQETLFKKFEGGKTIKTVNVDDLMNRPPDETRRLVNDLKEASGYSETELVSILRNKEEISSLIALFNLIVDGTTSPMSLRDLLKRGVARADIARIIKRYEANGKLDNDTLFKLHEIVKEKKLYDVDKFEEYVEQIIKDADDNGLLDTIILKKPYINIYQILSDKSIYSSRDIESYTELIESIDFIKNFDIEDATDLTTFETAVSNLSINLNQWLKSLDDRYTNVEDVTAIKIIKDYLEDIESYLSKDEQVTSKLTEILELNETVYEMQLSKLYTYQMVQERANLVGIDFLNELMDPTSERFKSTHTIINILINSNDPTLIESAKHLNKVINKITQMGQLNKLFAATYDFTFEGKIYKVPNELRKKITSLVFDKILNAKNTDDIINGRAVNSIVNSFRWSNYNEIQNYLYKELENYTKELSEKVNKFGIEALTESEALEFDWLNQMYISDYSYEYMKPYLDEMYEALEKDVQKNLDNYVEFLNTFNENYGGSLKIYSYLDEDDINALQQLKELAPAFLKEFSYNKQLFETVQNKAHLTVLLDTYIRIVGPQNIKGFKNNQFLYYIGDRNITGLSTLSDYTKNISKVSQYNLNDAININGANTINYSARAVADLFGINDATTLNKVMNDLMQQDEQLNFVIQNIENTMKQISIEQGGSFLDTLEKLLIYTFNDIEEINKLAKGGQQYNIVFKRDQINKILSKYRNKYNIWKFNNDWWGFSFRKAYEQAPEILNPIRYAAINNTLYEADTVEFIKCFNYYSKIKYSDEFFESIPESKLIAIKESLIKTFQNNDNAIKFDFYYNPKMKIADYFEALNKEQLWTWHITLSRFQNGKVLQSKYKDIFSKHYTAYKTTALDIHTKLDIRENTISYQLGLYDKASNGLLTAEDYNDFVKALPGNQPYPAETLFIHMESLSNDLTRYAKDPESLTVNKSRIDYFIDKDIKNLESLRLLGDIEKDKSLVLRKYSIDEISKRLNIPKADLEDYFRRNKIDNKTKIQDYNFLRLLKKERARSLSKTFTNLQTPGQVRTFLDDLGLPIVYYRDNVDLLKQWDKKQLANYGVRIEKVKIKDTDVYKVYVDDTVDYTKETYSFVKTKEYAIFDEYQKLYTDIFNQNRVPLNLDTSAIPADLFIGDNLNFKVFDALLNETLPEGVKQKLYSNIKNRIIKKFLKEDINIPNVNIIGDLDLYNDIVDYAHEITKGLGGYGKPFVTGDLNKAVYSSVIEGIKRIDSKNKYLQIIFSDDFALDSPLFRPILENATDAEIAELFKKHNYVATVLKEGRDGQPKVYKIIVDDRKSLQLAIDQGASILPYNVYRNAVLVINEGFFANKWMKIYKDFIASTYKILYLFSPGFIIRQYLDTAIVKNQMTTDGLAGIIENIKYQRKAQNAWDWYQDIYRKIVFEEGLDSAPIAPNVHRIKKYMDDNKMSIEDRQAFMLIDLFMNSGAISDKAEALELFFKNINLGKQDELYDNYTQLFLKTREKLTSSFMDLNSQIEQVNRLALFYRLIENGNSYTDAIKKIVDTHFDYTLKETPMELLNEIFWFSTFPINNIAYYLEYGLDNPDMLKTQMDLLELSYNDEDQMTWEDVRNSNYLTYNALVGNIRFDLDGKNYILKTGSSALDVFNIMLNPLGEARERLNPFLSTVVEGDLNELNPIGSNISKGKQIYNAIKTDGKEGSFLPSVYAKLYDNNYVPYRRYSWNYAYTPKHYFKKPNRFYAKNFRIYTKRYSIYKANKNRTTFNKILQGNTPLVPYFSPIQGKYGRSLRKFKNSVRLSKAR